MTLAKSKYNHSKKAIEFSYMYYLDPFQIDSKYDVSKEEHVKHKKV